MGSVALALFARKYLGNRPSRLSLRPLLLALVLLTGLVHAQAVHAEAILREIGSYLDIGAVACPSAVAVGLLAGGRVSGRGAGDVRSQGRAGVGRDDRRLDDAHPFGEVARVLTRHPAIR